MSQCRSAFQIKIMGSRARVNKGVRRRGWSMVSIGGEEGTFLRPDVGGKLKISPAFLEGVQRSWHTPLSQGARCWSSKRSLTANYASCDVCSTPLHAPATLPLPLWQHQPERESCQSAGIKPPIKRWLSHTQVMINGLYSLTQRRKENRGWATDGSFQLIT